MWHNVSYFVLVQQHILLQIVDIFINWMCYCAGAPSRRFFPFYLWTASAIAVQAIRNLLLIKTRIYDILHMPPRTEYFQSHPRGVDF